LDLVSLKGALRIIIAFFLFFAYAPLLLVRFIAVRKFLRPEALPFNLFAVPLANLGFVNWT
jgi:flagellar biogenesis protein FliO